LCAFTMCYRLFALVFARVCFAVRGMCACACLTVGLALTLQVGVRALVMSSHFRKNNFDEMISELIPNLHSFKSSRINSKVLPDLKCVLVL
jgi:hypothetical protein